VGLVSAFVRVTCTETFLK